MTLQFASRLPGEPISARCSVCKQTFIAKTYGAERNDDDRILAIRKQFEAHDCGLMSTAEPEPRSCWECNIGKVLCLPDGGKYVDCTPGNWKWHSCMARLLDTIENPFPSLPE